MPKGNLNSKMPDSVGDEGRGVYFSDGEAIALASGYMVSKGSLSPGASKTFKIPTNRAYLLFAANAIGLIIAAGYFYGQGNNKHSNVVNAMSAAIPTISYANDGSITVKASSQGGVDYRCFLV